MNTKNLIIAFITVSIVALIVSAFAVFTVARSWSQALLASATEAEDIRTEEVTKTPETTASPETSKAPQTAQEVTERETLLKETDTVAPEESSNQTLTEEESTSALSAYILKLEGDRLVITSPDGGNICERIIDTSALHPNDREALISGISFSDEKGAMSAIYDIIS